MNRPFVTTMMIAVVVALAAAAQAVASPIDVIRDCSEDGSLNRHYSQKELSGALGQLPSDLDEYTDCRSVIRGAQLAGAGGKGGRGARGVARRVNAVAPPSEHEQKKIAQASGSGEQVKIGGKTVEPGAEAAPLTTAGFGTDIPAAIIVVLGILGVTMLTGAAFGLQRRRLGEPLANRNLARPLRGLRDGIRRGISRRR